VKVVSVNIGRPQPIATKSGRSGIFKRPATGPVAIGPLGLEGDAIVDTENHGGRDQAVYVFFTPDYDWWTKELGVTLEPGRFGENLTVTELQSAAIRVGDRFEIGDVMLEVTSPRIPCVTLGARMGDPAFVKRFHRARRPGVYARVIRPGTVEEGQAVTYQPAHETARLAIDMM